jgi:CubicO group peptidase (beta-lactamase class C family)
MWGRARSAWADNEAMNADALRAWFDERVATHEFSGVALVWRDAVSVFEYAGGIAHRGHGVPITTETRFGVASVTKMVTATTALRLVERGELRLDQPLIEILPPEQHTKAMTAEHSLHHVLSHTSGLPNYHDDAAQTWDSFVGALDRIPAKFARRPADMLPLFADLPAERAPGEKYLYADANFILAGLVIEAATGRSFYEVAAEEVIGPAGMTDTAFEELDQDPARYATGYLSADGLPGTWRSNMFSLTAKGMPDGGMITTAHDLARLVDALLGGRLLSPPLLAAMMKPQGPDSKDVEQYGYGLELVVEGGAVTIVGHGGADPGVSTMVAHHLAAATTIVVLCNQDRGSWAAVKRITKDLGLTDPRDVAEAQD